MKFCSYEIQLDYFLQNKVIMSPFKDSWNTFISICKTLVNLLYGYKDVCNIFWFSFLRRFICFRRHYCYTSRIRSSFYSGFCVSPLVKSTPCHQLFPDIVSDLDSWTYNVLFFLASICPACSTKSPRIALPNVFEM